MVRRSVARMLTGMGRCAEPNVASGWQSETEETMMRKLALLAASLLAATSASAAEPPPAMVDEARALAKTFMSELKEALISAISEEGAPLAIGVCGAKAPGIATRLSTRSGWVVGRTALRVRNPRNAPSPEERAVLIRFLERARAGEDLGKMEYAAIVDHGGQKYLHYMKAIPTGKVCLTCHGTDIDPEVRKAIHARYPADAATGFALGDLRGAFTFVKPLE